MSIVRQAIRTAALDRRSPRDVLARANATLMFEHRAPMITALFAVYNMRTREISYSIAGHPRPLLVDENANTLELPGTGTPLGEIFDAHGVEERTATLPRSAALVFYTDGLIEYERNILGALDRLENIVRERTFLKSEEPAQALIDAMLDGHQLDDVAVLIMRVGVPE